MPAVWAIDGVEVPAAVARAVAFVGSGGAEGIVEPDGLRVAPLATPGTSIRVLPGAAVIRNRYPGGSLQSYALLEQVQQEVPIVATGSSGARTDMVIARVTDPEFASGTAGASFSVIRGVPSNAGAAYVRGLGYPAIPLARIHIPASTATITQDMITDLRSVARPRLAQRMYVFNPPNDRKMAAGTTDWQAWPVHGDGQGKFNDIEIPEWATVARILVSYTAIGARQNSWGTMRVLLGDSPQVQVSGSWDTTVFATADPYQIVVQVADEVAIPPGLRGLTVPGRVQAKLASETIAYQNTPWTTASSRVVVQIEFEERPA